MEYKEDDMIIKLPHKYTEAEQDSFIKNAHEYGPELAFNFYKSKPQVDIVGPKAEVAECIARNWPIAEADDILQLCADSASKEVFRDNRRMFEQAIYKMRFYC